VPWGKHAAVPVSGSGGPHELFTPDQPDRAGAVRTERIPACISLVTVGQWATAGTGDRLIAPVPTRSRQFPKGGGMSPNPPVRPATPVDAEAFAACHLACWREAYSSLWGADRFDGMDVARLATRRRKEIESGVADHYLVEEGDEVIGIAIAGPTRDDDPQTERELYAIYIREAHQGTGLADDLLRAAISDGPATLWTYRDNARASAFYVHHDFIPNGAERTDSEGILEIRMVRR